MSVLIITNQLKDKVMEKEFVPYQEALELKSIGFDEPCFGFYTGRKSLRRYTNFDGELNEFQTLKNSKITMGDEWCTAPTFSQAFRWFREKYGLFHSVEIYPIREERDRCWYVIHRVEKNEFDVFERNHVHMSGFFDNYSQAENGCLRKLIEIVKRK
jgi:hypothetical protein